MTWTKLDSPEMGLGVMTPMLGEAVSSVFRPGDLGHIYSPIFDVRLHPKLLDLQMFELAGPFTHQYPATRRAVSLNTK